MKILIVLITSLGLGLSVFAQVTELKLSGSDINQMFLENNLLLLVEKLNISVSDAEIVKAKQWSNPAITVSNVNFWNSEKLQGELLAPKNSSFGKNIEYAVEISQLYQTADKRKKWLDRETVSKEITTQQYELILKQLKFELHQSAGEILYYQKYQTVLKTLQAYLSQLVDSFRRQVLLGNFSKSDLIRLQAALLDVETELYETDLGKNEHLKKIKLLLGIDPLIQVELKDTIVSVIDIKNIDLHQLLDEALGNRNDLKLNRLQNGYWERSLIYERSKIIPDITFSVSYDRYAGIWRDYFGVGLSFDLPVFNRNQSEIEIARINYDQSIFREKYQKRQIENEIVQSFNNYKNSYLFYEKISQNEILNILDQMLDSYNKNLLSKGISMLEFIDFMDVYKRNKKSVLDAALQVQLNFEVLQFNIGKEIK